MPSANCSRTVLEHLAGRVPVIVTTMHFASAVTIERSRQAQSLGASMVMVMPPYHGATIHVGEAAVVDFFTCLSDAISIPIMIQDAPVAGTPLSAALLARMAREIAHVGYFKIETAGAAAKLRELIRLGGAAVEGPWERRASRCWPTWTLVLPAPCPVAATPLACG
jgi:dihydrodipicolinate synthase/N-acetylneuraminate lyase